ncbi:MAG: transposase [Synechococcus sp.]
MESSRLCLQNTVLTFRATAIFFLPPYCPQLNSIETEWHQFKTHELAGRQFDDELDLVDVIIAGIEARAHRHGRALERFLFN